MKSRVFIGFSLEAPWSNDLLQGRILDVKDRHMTLVFLGQVDVAKLQEDLLDFPQFPVDVGPVGKFDHCLFLPEKQPRVVAYHVEWLENGLPLQEFQKTLVQWLKTKGYQSKELNGFLPHVTIARAPFKSEEWEKTFYPIPLWVSGVHLYESLGNSCYQSLWRKMFFPPFEEREHTADIAFCVRGDDLNRLHLHAQIALAFEFPEILQFVREKVVVESLDEVIMKLNELIMVADRELGTPFKAVSYHGEIVETVEGHLEWEMIVDV